jgi:hypothetical protein
MNKRRNEQKKNRTKTTPIEIDKISQAAAAVRHHRKVKCIQCLTFVREDYLNGGLGFHCQIDFDFNLLYFPPKTLKITI